tara:strand:+ start:855 stop:1736 length:882 start_codon:yes stop_codon:yes gene_type:complete
MARLKQIPHDELVDLAREHETHLFAGSGIHLEPVPFNNPYIQMLWREHYVGSKGTVGRQLHYIVYYEGRAVGGISAGSAMFAHKKRDHFLEVGKEEKKTGLRNIVNNTMFRMTRPKNEAPLATEVLQVFKATVKQDWLHRYGDYVRAFETLVEPPRWGGIYKLDGWKRIGNTAGLGARRPEGHGTAGKKSTGVRKIIRVPVKIVWVQPICSWEDSLKKSKGTNSYGDDRELIVKFAMANIGREISIHQLAEGTGVTIKRLKILLYNLRERDGLVTTPRRDTFVFSEEMISRDD